jgi:serine/threonine-protein kinase RsbW
MSSQRQSYVATVRAIYEARVAARGFARGCGAAAEVVDAVALAVSEAVTNVALHAYRSYQTPGELELVLQAPSSERIEVVVADGGIGLLPRTDSPGLGVGLALIASVAETLEIEPLARGGVELRMSFGLRP